MLAVLRMSRHPRGQCAFTLIEVLVSMAILLLMVVMLHWILSSASGAWKLGEANKDRMQNARTISDFIANELESALLPLNRTSTNSLQLVVNPQGISQVSNRDSIFWQSPLAVDQALGDVAEIGYFVRWDKTNPQNPRAVLCRFFVNLTSRDPTGAVTANTNFLISSQPNTWLSNDVLNRVAPANASNDYLGLFAENVIGMWVSCLDSYGVPITKDSAGNTITPARTFNSRSGYTDSLLGAHPACALPTMIDLSFVLLDARSAVRVGPADMAAITGLVDTSTNADAFVDAALLNSALASFRPAFRAHHVRIHLRNSQ
ncbi:MAG: prepilin-type N-terminal cleavage/methylation domain-containing protein [Verrucomicrobia bacterium]|nr:prepilin-type N-terminal cleavage/methylation domain-containing protein [Verrucomicrobiota bacterium]